MRVLPNAESAALEAAGLFAECAAAAVAARGACHVALAGGSTPRAMYALLGAENTSGQARRAADFSPRGRPRGLKSAARRASERIDWSRVHVFFTDERCVPPDDPSSNYRMVRETLLDHVDIRPDHVHRMEGERPPKDAAERYDALLRDRFPRPDDQFDFVLLGMGADGHTASLFPGTKALDVTDAWCVANAVPNLDTQRITLTYPILNAARCVAFLVTGSPKADALRQVLSFDTGADLLPAQRITAHAGRLIWIVDAPAAATSRGLQSARTSARTEVPGAGGASSTV